MPQRPFDYIKEYYRSKIERDRKTLEFMHSQFDGFVTWIIGFAFTGLLLAIANIKTLELNLPVAFKVVATCLFVTIISGIVFRYISFFILSWEKGLEDYYIGAFAESTVMPFETDKEIEKANFDEIINRLFLDFGEKIEYPGELTEEIKRIELPQLKEHYRKLCNYARESMEIGIMFIADIEYTGHRIPKKMNIDGFEQAIKNPTIGYHANRWAIVRAWLFTLCLLSFVIAVIITFLLLIRI